MEYYLALRKKGMPPFVRQVLSEVSWTQKGKDYMIPLF